MIKTKGPRIVIFFILLAIIVVSYAFSGDLFENDNAPTKSVVLAFLIIVYYLGCWTLLHSSKTIQMGREGVHISILFCKRHYDWSRFQTIRYVDFRKCLIGQGKYPPARAEEGIIFSTRVIKRYPILIIPGYYLLFVHPFSPSVFYIQFPPNGYPYSIDEVGVFTGHYPCHFPVDKELFLSKIEEWGVKVEGINAPLPPEEEQARKRY